MKKNDSLIKVEAQSRQPTPARINEDQPATKEDSMDIRRYLETSVLSAVLLLACGIPGLAKNSRTLALTHDAVLSGKTLPAGKYVVQWDAHSPQATVEFARRHKVVLSTEGRLEDRGKKYHSNTVVYDTASDGSLTIIEIRFARSSEILVFNQ
jgi:hypothetical protein